MSTSGGVRGRGRRRPLLLNFCCQQGLWCHLSLNRELDRVICSQVREHLHSPGELGGCLTGLQSSGKNVDGFAVRRNTGDLALFIRALNLGNLEWLCATNDNLALNDRAGVDATERS